MSKASGPASNGTAKSASPAKTAKTTAKKPAAKAAKAATNGIAAPAEKPAAATSGVDANAAVAKETMEAAQAEAAKVAAEAVKQVSATAKAAFPHAADGIDALFEMQRAALDTWVQVGTIAAQGFEALGEDLAALNRATLDAAIKSGEKLLDCHTVQDVVDLQADFATRRMTAYVETSGEISNKAVKIAADMQAPIEAQVEKVMAASQPV